MSATPEKIGKYEIAGEIGRGSMGTVYMGHDPFVDRRVAIKVAHARYLDDSIRGKRFRKLFFNEAHAAGVLDHPNILKVYDADAEGDLCYLVMEYVPGARTLAEHVDPDRLLPLRQVVSIIYRAAKALDYAHRQGIIHRDIKPSNILLTRDEDIKLADFSVAMINRDDNAETQFMGYLGSPLYMSPEQATESTLDSRSDIFSLGSVMYELLAGRHPFKAETLSGIHRNITREEPVPIEELRNDLPGGLAYTLRRMLKKNPAKRYAMGLDLAADLALIFEDLESVVSEDSLREKFGSIKKLGFFKGFTDADIWELIRACSWQTYPAGSHVIEEGELDQAFYVVLSGVVCIEKNGHKLENLQVGDCFGEMGYLTQAKRSASVLAKTDVSLMKVNALTIDRAAEDTQLRFHKVFVRTLIKRLSETTASLSAAAGV